MSKQFVYPHLTKCTDNTYICSYTYKHTAWILNLYLWSLMTWTYQFFSPTLFFPFSLSSSKTVWSEQCSCTPLTGKCPSPSRATLLPSGSSKWREMPNLPLSSVLLCAHRLGERWRPFECTHDAICVFSCWANCFEVPWKSNVYVRILWNNFYASCLLVKIEVPIW